MAKELMEIGGFITEGAEIVNHDNSLSGNGTVDSPLGLNETVLWESSSVSGESNTSSSTARVMSEPITNFERIAIYDKTWNNTGCPYTRTEFEVDEYTQTFSTSDAWVDFSYQPTAGTSHYRGWTFYTLATDHKTLTTRGVYRKYVTSTGAAGTTTGNIIKIVGINRKAQ